MKAKKQLKKYRVNFYYDVSCSAYVIAKDKETAEKLVEEHLTDKGLNDWEYKINYEENDRSYGVTDIKKI